MKRILFAVSLLSLGLSAFAQTDQAATEVAALRAECAAKYTGTLQAKGANEYQFVYSKGQYRGEQVAGQNLSCSDSQYAAYVNTQDPVRVMNAYPTAAGRPEGVQSSSPAAK